MKIVYFLIVDMIMQHSLGLFQCKIYKQKGFVICFNDIW